MLKIITINVNGIRAAARKGFFEWMKAVDADVVCMQEVRAQAADLNKPVFEPLGYEGYFHYAEKKGYSGVAIYTKHKPVDVKTGLGWLTADSEGRYVEIDLGKLKVASIYLPSGTTGGPRQDIKMDFLQQYREKLVDIVNQKQSYIICGDWNIAHKKIDIKNWRGNQKNSGFLPEERAFLDDVFDNIGFVDAFRKINQAEDQYTWWSNRGQAWAKNVGWRIDYQVVSNDLEDSISSASIYKDERFSDHAPLIIDYNI